MHGVGGKPGWSWIFILEGLFTVLVGIASFWMVHDFPNEAKFLSPEDKQRVLRRLAQDKQGSSKKEDFQKAYLFQVLKDWKTYTGAVIYMGCDGVLYAFSLFIPSIIKNLGYSATEAQLLTVPPYALAAIGTVLVGWIADKTQKRGEFVTSPSAMRLLIMVQQATATCSWHCSALQDFPCWLAAADLEFSMLARLSAHWASTHAFQTQSPGLRIIQKAYMLEGSLWASLSVGEISTV